ncbi:MAG: hypothetical protein LW728_21845 [Microcystis sp. 49638_E5]|jgi:hypothetical protein|uniref:hypothetical protein n=1 Tax=Microcystis sp. 49638_E5 TaxID=2904986 RepID=UPI002586245D|nr:hypothetical protein [Microcystis sp. 49638_E5]MCE2671784.1 hypothetical protein [Microcystis sp. 49638_E5]
MFSKSGVQNFLNTAYSNIPNKFKLWVIVDGVPRKVLNSDGSEPFLRTINVKTNQELALLDGYSFDATIYRATVIGAITSGTPHLVSGLPSRIRTFSGVINSGIPTANDSWFLTEDDGAISSARFIALKHLKRELKLDSFDSIYLIREPGYVVVEQLSSTRVTQNGNRRVTRNGNIRVSVA